MIEFFRDVLDGPLYIVTTIISIIFIMAIIGFLMERKKLEKEKKQRIAVVANDSKITPIPPVEIENPAIQKEVTIEESTPQVSPVISSSNMEETTNQVVVQDEVKTPVIVFDDNDQKKE